MMMMTMLMMMLLMMMECLCCNTMLALQPLALKQFAAWSDLGFQNVPHDAMCTTSLHQQPAIVSSSHASVLSFETGKCYWHVFTFCKCMHLHAPKTNCDMHVFSNSVKEVHVRT